MFDTCEHHHDLWGFLLTWGLIAGLFASYAPQHLKIIWKRSSEGFSPWFLLLGATSSAAGMLNMWIMQWEVVKCCRYISAGSCMESLGGVMLVSLQWLLFNVNFILYLIYYPLHLKYTVIAVETPEGAHGVTRVMTTVKTHNWALSVRLAWAVTIHLVFCTFVSIYFLLFQKQFSGDVEEGRLWISKWATFLGLTSAALAVIQYLPQIVHTYRLKLVGALSIPMMLIQSPGAALMVTAIIMRPGTNWTSWIMFAVSGIMQAILLFMCIAWKVRQARLGIDDFGHPLDSHPGADEGTVSARTAASRRHTVASYVDVTGEDAEGASERELSPLTDEEIVRAMLGEDTPLLRNAIQRDRKGDKNRLVGWLKGAIKR